MSVSNVMPQLPSQGIGSFSLPKDFAGRIQTSQTPIATENHRRPCFDALQPFGVHRVSTWKGFLKIPTRAQQTKTLSTDETLWSKQHVFLPRSPM
eukprot:scaffold207_cov345-Pavlova_lutheri.AAC.37